MATPRPGPKKPSQIAPPYKPPTKGISTGSRPKTVARAVKAPMRAPAPPPPTRTVQSQPPKPPRPVKPTGRTAGPRGRYAS